MRNLDGIFTEGSEENEDSILGLKTRLRYLRFLLWALLFLPFLGGTSPANAQVNVTQEHNHLSRDGLYIDSAFTPANAANLTRDLGFDGTTEVAPDSTVAPESSSATVS